MLDSEQNPEESASWRNEDDSSTVARLINIELQTLNNKMANVKEFSVEEKLTSLVTLQKIESKLDEVHILKGELPMEVADLEDEIRRHRRPTRQWIMAVRG